MFYKGPEAGRIGANVTAKGVEDHDFVGLEEETTKMTDVRELSSDAGRRLRRLRHELVLQLYLRRDPLWEAIRDVRDRWNISAEVRLPPPVVGYLSLEGMIAATGVSPDSSCVACWNGQYPTRITRDAETYHEREVEPVAAEG